MLSDVIAALATPPGRSAVALIRISGAGAHETEAQVIPGFQREPWRSARLGRIVHTVRKEMLDEVLYVTFRAPASYPGEDMVEISTHGGLLVPAEVLAALIAAGARQAAAGATTTATAASTPHTPASATFWRPPSTASVASV
jgi:tRNA modification GTPase